MNRLISVFLGAILLSAAWAAVPIVIEGKSVPQSTRTQNVLLRRALRMQHIGMRIPQTNIVRRTVLEPIPKFSRRSSSSSSYSYTGTPVRGVLQIDQQSTGPSDHVAGTAAVTLVTFDATAGNEDVILSTLKFSAQQGDLSAADQYELYAVSASGDRNRVSTAPFSASVVTFANFQFALHAGVPQRFIVTARLRSGASPSLALGFLTSDPLFVQAQGVRYGRDLAPGIQVDSIPCQGPYVCRVFVHTRSVGAVTVHERGNLFVTKDSQPAPSHQLLLGETSTPVLRLNFHATDEDVAVTYIAINGGNGSVSGLELYTDGSSVPFATAREVQCDSAVPGQFCAQMSGGLFTVPRDHDMRVIVRARTKAKILGGVSGETFAPYLRETISSNPVIKARGISSGKDLSQNNGDGTADGEIFIGRSTPGGNAALAGATHDAVAATVLNIDNADPDADLSAVPYGNSTFAAFRFTAAPNQNSRFVTITTLVFTVSAQSVQVDGIRLFNTADSGKTVTCSQSATTGTITVMCLTPPTSNVVTSIDQNSTATLALRGNITSTAGGGTGFLQAVLGNLGNRDAPGTVVWTDDVSTFSWVDVPVTQVRSTQYRS